VYSRDNSNTRLREQIGWSKFSVAKLHFKTRSPNHNENLNYNFLITSKKGLGDGPDKKRMQYVQSGDHNFIKLMLGRITARCHYHCFSNLDFVLCGSVIYII